MATQYYGTLQVNYLFFKRFREKVSDIIKSASKSRNTKQLNPLSAKPTKCSNTIKTILLGWCLKGNTMSNNFQTKCKLTGNYRTLSSIIDKAFCENSLRSKSVYCFHEKIHLRRVTGP